MIEPLVQMSERVEVDLDASAMQAKLDEEAFAGGFSYGPQMQEPKHLNGLVTDDERTD